MWERNLHCHSRGRISGKELGEQFVEFGEVNVVRDEHGGVDDQAWSAARGAQYRVDIGERLPRLLDERRARDLAALGDSRLSRDENEPVCANRRRVGADQRRYARSGNDLMIQSFPHSLVFAEPRLSYLAYHAFRSARSLLDPAPRSVVQSGRYVLPVQALTQPLVRRTTVAPARSALGISATSSTRPMRLPMSEALAPEATSISYSISVDFHVD